jgi:hypothetical protein
MPAAMSPSTPPMGKASAAAGARLMEDVERALARVDPLSSSHLSASPSARRVVTALHGERGLAKLDLERRLVSRAACDALAELQRRLDAAQEETRDAIAERDRARAERDVCERDRRNERTEWLANRDAVRREISLARDRVAAVKEEHKRNLVELDRERRRVKVACEETEAVRDELARLKDSNELLRRRLARLRGEIAKKSAEAVARDDAADSAFAANARNAAIAAREALRRDDDEDVRLLGDGGVEKKKENLPGTTSDEAGGALSSPSPTDGKVFHPEKFGDGISRDVFSARDLERHGSRADWARAYGRVVAELDAARARAAKAESALAAATAAGQKRAVSDAETSETTDGLTNASLVTRAEAAEARSLRLARLNAGLLDRLGEAVGAAPRHGEEIQRVSFFFNLADEEENAVQEVGRDVFVATTKRKSALAEKPSEANVLQDSEVKREQTHDAHDEDEGFFEGASSVTRKRDVLRALESEVKLLDAEYRETIDAIKRVHDGFAGGDSDRRRLNTHTIEVDALAARANSLEDAIVRKVEEVQRLRDDVFGVSRKIEL